MNEKMDKNVKIQLQENKTNRILYERFSLCFLTCFQYFKNTFKINYALNKNQKQT